jgi:hypothetical protein
MVPAHERLRADDAPVLEIDLRLIEELELAFGHGPLELHLEQETRLKLVADRAIEHDVPAAADRLGAVQREIGIAEQPRRCRNAPDRPQPRC